MGFVPDRNTCLSALNTCIPVLNPVFPVLNPVFNSALSALSAVNLFAFLRALRIFALNASHRALLKITLR